MFAAEKKLTNWCMLFAVLALSIGSLFGPMQALEHAGINMYPALEPLGLASYYQGLSLHGVLNALVWTTFFIEGFLTLVVARTLNRPMSSMRLSWGGFFLMVVGLVLAAIPLLLNQASVLYTFYPPMQASAMYYIGLVLFVVGSWIMGWSIIATYIAWRRANKGETTPFMALASVITVVLWQICTLGVATEILVFILPWSLGLISGIDSELSRTFFWFTGHALVYFWLLPAYISWYGMLPKQAGGKLFSEPLARLAFWLFLVLSTPVGFHHQYVDPGVPTAWKVIQGFLTYGVFFPSLLTMFNVIASLEIGGRARGGKGVLGWIRTLPWGNPSVTAQLLAGITFALGGVGGLINASYNLNLVIHNTAWVPGHLHLTVGTGVTLTFMGILYWLLPYTTGRALWAPKLAVAQAWTWFIGVLIFSRGMHWIGLLGAPRRTQLGSVIDLYGTSEWRVASLMTGVGGTIMFISIVMFVLVVVMTAYFSKQRVETDMPIAEAASREYTPGWLNNWRPWLAVTIALLVLSYGPALVTLIGNAQFTSPGFRVW